MDDALDIAIEDFASRLVPEALTRATTAYGMELVEHVEGPDAFERWTEGCRQTAAAFEYPFGGHPAGLVMAESDGQRWCWHREPCCELGWLTGRVNREVADFPEPWVFVANTPGPAQRWVEVENADGAREEILVTPTPRWTVPWYAEARGRRLARIHTGVMVMDDWQVVGHDALPTGTAFERAARQVLRRHPDRRRHRLR